MVRWLLCLCFFAPLLAQEPAIERGRRIYREGKGASEITALLGNPPTQVPASALPCAGCHGQDGRGKPEGGIDPADITWSALTKPYQVALGDRERGPYTPTLLKRAITLGQDSAGNPLHEAMPRYRLSLQDAADLVAYLQAIESDRDPGIGEDSIRITVPMAPGGWQNPNNQLVKNSLEAWRADLNKGGIYGRFIQITYLTVPSDRAGRLVAIREHITNNPPFALLAAYAHGIEAKLAELCLEHQLPAVASLALDPPRARPPNPQVFYLYAGLDALSKALVEKAAASGPSLSAILAPEPFREAAVAIQDSCAANGWPVTPHLEILSPSKDPNALVQLLVAKKISQVFYLGAPNEPALLKAIQTQAWRPDIYAPAPLTSPALLKLRPHLKSLHLAALQKPKTPTWRAMQTYQIYRQSYPLPEAPGPVQMQALAAARILQEALVRSGHQLTRARLQQALVSLQDHETGFSMAITYGPNRRVGSDRVIVF